MYIHMHIQHIVYIIHSNSIYYVQPYTALVLYSPIQPYRALWSHIQPYTAIYSPIQSYTALYNSMQLYTTLCSPIQPSAALSSTIQPYTEHYPALYNLISIQPYTTLGLYRVV